MPKLNPNEAPQGHIAVLFNAAAESDADCTGCPFVHQSNCGAAHKCLSSIREDGCEVTFRKAPAEPGGIDPDEAPEGYIAVKYIGLDPVYGCKGCAFYYTDNCQSKYPCTHGTRKDGHEVCFHKKPTPKGINPDEAPPGLIAVEYNMYSTTHNCSSCVLHDTNEGGCSRQLCSPHGRADEQHVCFHKKPTTQKDETMSDQKPNPHVELSKLLNLKAGDHVKVVAQCPHYHLGWGCAWNSLMTAYVGKTYPIKSINHLAGARLGTTFSFPVWVLEKVDPPVLELPSLAGHKAVTRPDGTVKVGCQTVDLELLERWDTFLEAAMNLPFTIPLVHLMETATSRAVTIDAIQQWINEIKVHVTK